MIELISSWPAALLGTAAVNVLLKATVFFAFGLIVIRAMRRSTASARHSVLAGVFVAALLLPLGVILVPRLEVRIPIPALLRPRPAVLATTDTKRAGTREADSSSREAEETGWVYGSVLSPEILFRTLWFAGSSILLLRLIVHVLRLHHLRRDGIPCLVLCERLRMLAAERGVARDVELLVNREIAGPLTCGWLHPVVLLPIDAEKWSDADLRRALVHEFEHIKRADWPVQLMAQLVVTLYWFHPLAWSAFRKLCLQAEQACDDAVLELDDSTLYAEQLVMLARCQADLSPHGAIGMARPSDLAARVRAVLDPDQVRSRANTMLTAMVLGTAVCAVSVLAPIRALAQVAGERRTSSAVDEAARPTPLDRQLFEAAYHAYTTAVQKLLAAGARTNVKLDGDGTALIAAARNGHNEIVTLLLNQGASPDLGVEGDGSPLIMAAQNRHLSTVRVLLDRGADINMAVPGDGSPLIMAARGGSTEVVELLLNRGANIEQVVPGDENALIEASASGHLPVVKLLVARGANVKARVWVEGSLNKPGEWRSPLSMARRNGRTEVVNYLTGAGALE